MPDNKTRQEILKRVLESPEFVHARKHKQLLTYLVDASMQGRTPDEYSIAVDVFGKDADYNPNIDTNVRVNVFHLRKKLDKYYQKEGKNEPIRIEIPRGHYAVSFVKNDNRVRFVEKKLIPLLAALIIMLTLFVAGYIIVLQRENTKLNQNLINQAVQAAQHPVWSVFNRSSLPNLIVLGEIYFFRKYDPDFQQFVLVRYNQVESDDELEQLEQQYPSVQFEASQKNSPAYFAMNSVWPLVDILPVCMVSDQAFYLQRSSAVTPRELKENNIIYVGYYRSLALLESMNQRLNYKFDIPQKQIVIQNGPLEIKRYDPTPSFKQTHIDYCIVKKLPGPNRNTILLVSSFSASGSRGAVKYLTGPGTLSELTDLFETKYEKFPEYFELLFKVSGYERSDLDTKVIEYRKVEPDAELW